MKKLYRRGTVHPSPSVTADHMSFLPATILTLAAALSPEDKQVLAYLISCSNNDFGNLSSHRKSNTPKTQAKRSFGPGGGSGHDHPPLFTCDCFRCYMSYWIKWDSSPNRQLIHEIIDAFEDEVAQSKKTKTKTKKERKRKGGSAADNRPGGSKEPREDSVGLNTVEPSGGGDGGYGGGDDGEEGTEKGSVRRLVNFIGERIWNVWGQ
ncbi:hypothetical protein V6N13_033296 [Hibiscus sabdariffa]|uniref:Uncharacterized protein n=1 Tax=Hibiscus sabdariffa TaxID=183260 RepID=A0ABR2FAU7_9ROSI